LRLSARQTLQRHHARKPPYGLRRALLVAVLALIAVMAFVASQPNDKRRTHSSTEGWPLVGQGAYVIGNGRPAVSPHQHPVPIASVAKVMTAYLVLKHYPLRASGGGRRFVVGQRDVADTATRLRLNQSLVAVRAGEQLTERDALMAILLPSANNVAALVARQVDGSVASFVAEMNRTARAAVWPTATGSRSVIGVVLGQRGGDALGAGLSSAKQLVERLEANAGGGTSSSSGSDGRPRPSQPALGTAR
jgi:hypothetical protein